MGDITVHHHDDDDEFAVFVRGDLIQVDQPIEAGGGDAGALEIRIGIDTAA